MATKPPFNPPPIGTGPFVDPWSTPHTGQIRRPSVPRVPIQAGGMAVSANSQGVFDLSRFAVLNGSKVFTVGTTSQLAVAQPDSFRNYLMIRNASANVVYVDFGADATVNSTLALAAGEVALWDSSVPQDDIHLLASAASSIVSISYGNIAIPGAM